MPKSSTAPGVRTPRAMADAILTLRDKTEGRLVTVIPVGERAGEARLRLVTTEPTPDGERLSEITRLVALVAGLPFDSDLAHGPAIVLTPKQDGAYRAWVWQRGAAAVRVALAPVGVVLRVVDL